MDAIEIRPVARPLDATIRPPGSKSLTNRALVAAALAEGDSELLGALESEDTRVMIDGLRQLGIAIDADSNAQRSACEAARPVAAAAADSSPPIAARRSAFSRRLSRWATGRFGSTARPGCASGRFRICLDALGQLGVGCRKRERQRLPAGRRSCGGAAGGRATVRGDISSQFLSGLLLAAPYAAAPITFEIEGRLVSQPYVRMTLAVMREFWRRRRRGRPVAVADRAGAVSRPLVRNRAGRLGRQLFLCRGGDRGRPRHRRGPVARQPARRRRVLRLSGANGLRSAYTSQGGITVSGGTLRGIDVDMNAISDTVQTLAAVALFADGPTTIRNVAHIRHKETDRIGNLAVELRKFGARSRSWPTDCGSSRARCTRANRHLQRSSHGDEPGAGRSARAGRRHRRPRLHGKDLSGFLPRSGVAGQGVNRTFASRWSLTMRSPLPAVHRLQQFVGALSSNTPESCGGAAALAGSQASKCPLQC